MKKYASYIFIAVALMGVFSSPSQTHAQALGTCTQNGGATTVAPIPNVTQDSCITGTWTLTTNGACEWVPGDPNTGDPTGAGADNQPCTPSSTTPANCQLGKYCLLAPLPGLDQPVDVTGTNTLGTYLNVIIKLAIGIAAVLAMLMIIMGGIQYMTSDFISSKEEGKHRITNAIFGLLVALGAWLILYTINPNLLNTNVAIAPTTIQYDVDTPQTPTTVNGKQMYGSWATGANWEAIAGPETALPPGVTTWHGECAKVGDTGCVSTRALSTSSIVAVQNQCPNIPLQINGGTESWLHSANTTHRPGSATVDLQSTPALDACLSGGQPLVNLTRYPPGGPNLYENNHWHIGY